MSLPEENASAPPVWEPTTSFQYSFEDNESTTLWDTYTNVTAASTGGAADGDKYGSVPYNAVLRKYINCSSAFWVRACLRISSTHDADRELMELDYGAGHTSLVKVSYVKSSDKLQCSLTSKTWARTDGWQTIEYLINVADQVAYSWCDGTYLGSAAIADVAAETLRLTFGDQNAATTFHLDAVKVESSRTGLPGRVAPTVGGYVREGDIELDGLGFNLLEGQYQEQDISGFAPRMGTGAPAYSDLSGFQHFLIPSLHHGIGQVHMGGEGEGDENSYLNGYDVDTTGVGVVRVVNAWEDTDELSSVTPYDVMPAGEILSCQMAGKSVYGLKFASAKASASYPVLFWRDGATLNSKSFTCTDGVRGLYYNGQYLFVSLGGSALRMQKTANLTDWTDVGSDSLPPVNMGAIAAHDEFLWVADALNSIVYRAGQTDASDLAKETETGLGAHRVGPGSVPINSMCSFQGRLYVGRQDGLYAITQDADYVYVQCVETFPTSTYNCRSMTVYEGYLVFAVGRQVYRLGGVSESGLGAKMDITPGPLSDSFPYTAVTHWDAFTVANGYLFAVGYTGAHDEGGIYCYNGSGWHRLYAANNLYGIVGYPVGLDAAPSTTNEPRLHRACCKAAAGGGVFQEWYASARLGSEAPVGETYDSAGYLETSWMSFGLPLVPKLFRMVRFDVEGANYANPILVTYTVDTGQEHTTGTLGVLVQPDANFLLFPAGTWGNRLQLQLTPKWTAGTPPVIRRIVIQYMDRPAAVWGYSMTLDLSSPSRTQASTSGSHTVESLRQHLRQCREKASYVRFVDRDGNESDVFVSDGPRFAYVGNRPVATLTLMVVKRYLNTPGAVGVSAA